MYYQFLETVYYSSNKAVQDFITYTFGKYITGVAFIGRTQADDMILYGATSVDYDPSNFPNVVNIAHTSYMYKINQKLDFYSQNLQCYQTITQPPSTGSSLTASSQQNTTVSLTDFDTYFQQLQLTYKDLNNEVYSSGTAIFKSLDIFDFEKYITDQQSCYLPNTLSIIVNNVTQKIINKTTSQNYYTNIGSLQINSQNCTDDYFDSLQIYQQNIVSGDPVFSIKMESTKQLNLTIMTYNCDSDSGIITQLSSQPPIKITYYLNDVTLLTNITNQLSLASIECLFDLKITFTTQQGVVDDISSPLYAYKQASTLSLTKYPNIAYIEFFTDDPSLLKASPGVELSLEFVSSVSTTTLYKHPIQIIVNGCNPNLIQKQIIPAQQYIITKSALVITTPLWITNCQYMKYALTVINSAGFSISGITEFSSSNEIKIIVSTQDENMADTYSVKLSGKLKGNFLADYEIFALTLIKPCKLYPQSLSSVTVKLGQKKQINVGNFKTLDCFGQVQYFVFTNVGPIPSFMKFQLNILAIDVKEEVKVTQYQVTVKGQITSEQAEADTNFMVYLDFPSSEKDTAWLLKNPNQIVKSPDFYNVKVKINSISQTGEMLVQFLPELQKIKSKFEDNKQDINLYFSDANGKPRNVSMTWNIIELSKSQMKIRLSFERPLEISSRYHQIKILIQAHHKQYSRYWCCQICFSIYSCKNCLTLPLVRSTTLQYLWGMINQIQIITHLPLNAIDMPDNAKVMYSTIIDIANFNDNIDYISTRLSIVVSYMLLVICGIQFLTAVVILNNVQKKIKDSQFKKLYGTLWDGLKTDKKVTLFPNLIFMLRRIIMCYFLVFNNQGYIQIVISTISTLFIALYYLYFKPYEDSMQNKIEVFNEICILITCYHLLFYIDAFEEMTEEFKDNSGFSMIGITGVSLAFNTLISFQASCRDIRFRCKRFYIKFCLDKKQQAKYINFQNYNSSQGDSNSSKKVDLKLKKNKINNNLKEFMKTSQKKLKVQVKPSKSKQNNQKNEEIKFNEILDKYLSSKQSKKKQIASINQEDSLNSRHQSNNFDIFDYKDQVEEARRVKNKSRQSVKNKNSKNSILNFRSKQYYASGKQNQLTKSKFQKSTNSINTTLNQSHNKTDQNFDLTDLDGDNPVNYVNNFLDDEEYQQNKIWQNIIQ
eukprot:403369784